MTRVLLLWTTPTSANLGVRALGEGTAALVHRIAPDAEVLMQSYGQGESPVNIGVVRSLARELLLDSRGLRSWVRTFDLVVDTRAGDSFADIYGLSRLRSIVAMGEFVRDCGVPLVLGPQTLGPFQTRSGRALGRWSLRRASRVLARDSASAATAEEFGRPVDVLTTDVVFALPQPEPCGEFDVLFNVSGLLWNSGDHGSAPAYRAAARRVVSGLLERGRSVTILSHVLDSRNADNDVPTATLLQREFGLDHVIPESLDDVRAAVKGAQLVIGSRMHACLNSLSVGTPAIPLAYSRKFAPLLADLGWRHVVDLGAADPGSDILRIIDGEAGLTAEAGRVRATADLLLARAERVLGEFL